MSLKTQIEADSTVFFNADDFAEAVLYNGQAVVAVPELGATLQRGNTIDSDGVSDRALFWLKVSDVAEPEPGDEVTHNNKTWTVLRLVESDSASHCVECVGQVSPYRLGR